MGEGQADGGKAPGAQILGPDKLEDAFEQEDQAHNHSDEDHGKVLAHHVLHSPAASSGAVDFRNRACLLA